MNKKIFLLLPCIAVLAASCNNASNIKQDAVLEVHDHKYSIQLADTPQKRADGLSGVAKISDGEGMLFLFSEPQHLQFWMKGMLFPLDIIWINGDKVVDISDGLQPEPGKDDASLNVYSPITDADKALEVNSGWALRHDVKIGDTITYTKLGQ